MGIKPKSVRPTSTSFSLTCGSFVLSLATRDWQTTGTYKLAFSNQEIEKAYEDFVAMDIPLITSLIEIDGQKAFVALDPDGNKVIIYKSLK